MSIPSFDVYGLLPAGVHDCTLAEIEATFASNAHRSRLYWDFASCLENELRPRFNAPVYVDGSFVTNVDSPNDIDVVIDMTQASREERQQGLRFWHLNRKRLMVRYRVDFWLNVLGGQDMIVFFQGLKARTARFADLREDHRKGILRIA